MNSSIRRLLVGLTGTFGICVLVLGAPIASVASDPTGGSRAFSDAGNGTTFAVSIDTTSPNVGRFQFSQSAIGLIWPSGRATILTQSDHSVIVRYEGDGEIDADARLDPVFGFHEPSGNYVVTPIRLEAQINPDRVTATADLWLNGVHYSMVDRKPTPDADADLSSIVTLLRSERWSELYGWMFSGVTSTMSQAQFVSGITASFASHGHISAVTIAEQPTYASGRGGFDSAFARLNVTFAEPTGARSYLVNVTLISEDSGWKVVTMAVAP